MVGIHSGIKIFELAKRSQHLGPQGGGVLLGESQGDQVRLEASLIDQGCLSLDSARTASGATSADGFVLA